MTTPQVPLRAGFGPATTAAEVLAGRRLDGRHVVVTGGASGLGLETTRVLAAAGARVTVAARDLAKARQALAGLDRVELAPLDLMEPASIAAFARDVAGRGPVHALVNNAGIMAVPLARDGRGHESHFSANHLGHFELALRLWPALVAADGARVVSVSSRAHRLGGVDFDDPDFERRPYDKWQAYAQAKSANVLFAVALDRRGAAHGVRAFAVHPGTILTELMRDLAEADLRAFGLDPDAPRGVIPAGRSLDDGGDLKTVAQGAATGVWCAVHPALDGLGGVYCEDVDIAAAVAAEAADPRGVRPWAIDPVAAERLWQLSERLTGLALPVADPL